MSKETRDKIWILAGCLMLTVGVHMVFGQGWMLIMGGTGIIASHFLEAVIDRRLLTWNYETINSSAFPICATH